MKVLHVTTGMRKASGVTTFVENVTAELRRRGVEVAVVMKETDLTSCDIVHIHGLWSPLLHRASKWARQRGIPVVWSTHGMTAPWSMRHKWWKKLPAWLLYQKRDLKRAAAIHCTTDLEVEWNQALGFKNCFVAPLGTRLPDSAAGLGRRSGSTAEGRTLLFVGRIYPVKALDQLIEAFARVDESVRRNWVLRLVGPDQAGHMAELMALCDRLGLTYSTPEQNGKDSTVDLDLRPRPQVEFAGPKFNEGLDAEYANCDCLALVSHTENFGATVVDAMAHGKPVITSTKTPWKVVADNKCGWWVDNDVATLTAALREVCGMEGLRAPRADAPSGDLTVGGYLPEMGRRGRELVRAHYTWSAVCDKMLRGYEEVVR